MIVAVIALAVAVLGLGGCLIWSQKLMHAENGALIRALVAKHGSELALLERTARRDTKVDDPAPPAESFDSWRERLARETAEAISAVEGREAVPAQPTGLDGY